MGDDASRRLRGELVGHLRRHGHLSDPRVAAAFLATPREIFLRDHADRHGLRAVYRDEAVVTRRDPETGMPRSSSSQPAIMARMLAMLDVDDGHRVLEIGAGTGYNAALLGHLTGPAGEVTSVELDDAVAASASAALEAAGSAARVVVADGRAKAPGSAPVDRLIVTASSETVHRAWFDQLAPGGRLVVPLRLSPVLFGLQAVVAFARVPGGFDAVQVTTGVFMALRGRADRDPRVARVTVAETADEVDEPPLVELSGPPISALDATARQRLAVTLLGFARRRSIELGPASSWALAAYAALGLPPERLVECSRAGWSSQAEEALGVVDPIDGSVAFLVGGRGARIEAHGGTRAERCLLNVIDRWCRAGRPGADRLTVRVRYGPERPLAWCSVRRADHWIAFDWRPAPRLAPTPP